MLLLSHLFIDKHQARTAEWKALLPSVSPPGGAITLLLVLTSLPPQGPDQETPPALEDSSLGREEETKRVVKGFENFRVFFLVVAVFKKSLIKPP